MPHLRTLVLKKLPIHKLKELRIGHEDTTARQMIEGWAEKD